MYQCAWVHGQRCSKGHCDMLTPWHTAMMRRSEQHQQAAMCMGAEPRQLSHRQVKGEVTTCEGLRLAALMVPGGQRCAALRGGPRRQGRDLRAAGPARQLARAADARGVGLPLQLQQRLHARKAITVMHMQREHVRWTRYLPFCSYVCKASATPQYGIMLSSQLDPPA